MGEKMNQQFENNTYYSRQTILHEIGEEGQKRLRQAKLAVVGLGGLGCVSALYLTLSGVGHLTLIDQDTIEMNNLHRQPLYSLNDIRHPKVEVAARRLSELNPKVEIEAIPENVNQENADSILAHSDCIVDGLDNMYTRYLLNRYCVDHQVPFVFGGAIGLEGNVAVFKTPETPCLECILPGIDDQDLPTCDTRGVLGATAGIIGSLQALETIKLLAQVNPKTESKLMVFDFASSEFKTLNLHVRKDCPICQTRQRPTSLKKRLAWLCGSNTVNVNPEQISPIDLNQISQVLREKHTVFLLTPMVLVFDHDGHEVSLFKHGRMLIKNVGNESDALKIYMEIDEILRNRTK